MNSTTKEEMGLIKPEQLQTKMQEELSLATLPADLKKKVANEFARLCALHPGWKKHRGMRKAGEKYNLNFEFK
jgi:hypothetical protein